MTLFDVGELSRYWAKCPPVHVAVAVYLGIGAAGKFEPAAGSFDPGNMQAFLSQAAAQGVPVSDRSVHEGLPQPVDFATLRAQAMAKRE